MAICGKCTLEYNSELKRCPRCSYRFWLKGCFAGFLVAATGLAIGFSIDYGPDEPISFFAFAIVLCGILIGLTSILGGWYSIFRSHRRIEK